MPPHAQVQELSGKLSGAEAGRKLAEDQLRALEERQREQQRQAEGQAGSLQERLEEAQADRRRTMQQVGRLGLSARVGSGPASRQ